MTKFSISLLCVCVCLIAIWYIRRLSFGCSYLDVGRYKELDVEKTSLLEMGDSNYM